MELQHLEISPTNHIGYEFGRDISCQHPQQMPALNRSRSTSSHGMELQYFSHHMELQHLEISPTNHIGYEFGRDISCQHPRQMPALNRSLSTSSYNMELQYFSH